MSSKPTRIRIYPGDDCKITVDGGLLRCNEYADIEIGADVLIQTAAGERLGIEPILDRNPSPQKVEIVVTSNQDPSRIAQEIAKQLSSYSSSHKP